MKRRARTLSPLLTAWAPPCPCTVAPDSVFPTPACCDARFLFLVLVVSESLPAPAPVPADGAALFACVDCVGFALLPPPARHPQMRCVH